MKFNFDKFINRYRTNSIKWCKYKNTNIIPLWIADSDFMSPPCIIKDLKKRVDHGIFGYGNHIPINLIDIIINRMSSLYNWNIKPEWIIFLPGVVSGLHICVRAFTNEKESVIIPNPIYPPFQYAAKIVKRKIIKIPLCIENKRFIMNINNITDNFDGKEKLLMLCNPHNPVGTVYEKKELYNQFLFAKKYDLIICSDEIHSDLIIEPKLHHVPIASLEEDALQRTITLFSPSKTFNIAGLSIAFAIIANKDLRKKFNEIKTGIIPSVNVLAITAAESAFKKGQEWLDQQIIYLRKNRDLLVSYINQTKYLSMYSPEGTYLSWIDTSKLKNKKPHKWFEEYGLGVSPGYDFGDSNFVRLNFACRKKLLIEVIKKINFAIKNTYKDEVSELA